MRKVTKEWLDRSKDDLEVIEKIIDIDNLTNMVSFHAQQSIEKSLKAVIEEYSLGFIRTHSLIRLLDVVDRYIKVDDIELTEKLDKLYIEARYPTELGLLPEGKPSKKDSKEFYQFAENIHKKVREILK